MNGTETRQYWVFAMKDMHAHLEKLRNDAAECARIAGEATDEIKRTAFSKLAAHLTILANEVEREIKEIKADYSLDTFLGRKTQEPFPKQEE